VRASLIASGTLNVPALSIRTNVASSIYEEVQCTLEVDHVLKGKAVTNIAVTYYTKPRDHSPRPDVLVSLNGKKALLFLRQSADSATPEYYFAERVDALQEAEPQTVNRVKAEVEEQQRILSHFAALFPPERSRLYYPVKNLIDATLSKSTQRDALLQLEAIGPKAVPSIILLMDDRRTLAVRAIELKNTGPDSWEDSRYYRPELVVDALAAILNQITGEHFGFSYNGGSETERRHEVDAWRLYLYHMKTSGR